MKKFKLKLYTAAFASLALFTACDEDRLELLPPLNDVLDTSIRSEADVEKFAYQVYDVFQGSSLFGADMLIHGDLISDNSFVSNKNDGYFININNLNITTDSNLGHYGGFYSVFRYTNTVLNYENYIAPGIDAADFDQAVVNRAQSIAKAARGLSLFYLVNLYSSSTKSGQHQDFGVPVYTTPYDSNARFARESVDAVYEQAIKDLEESLAHMDDVPADKGHFSKTAVNLILSRVYLTRGKAGDYEKSIQYADAVINGAPSSAFAFVGSDAYNTYFSSTDIALSENQPETVWEINMTASDNPGINNAIGSFYARTGPHASLIFRHDFYETFDETDVRRTLLPNAGPVEDQPRGWWTTKWSRNTTAEGNFTQNVKVLRMSEAKLNKIEAMYNLGQNADALILLNEFAATRGATTQYTGADLLADIMTERRKEFFAEGHRFFDLKRNNLGFVKATNCSGTNCDVPANSRFFVLPMTNTAEMLLNPLMTQHPLWQ